MPATVPLRYIDWYGLARWEKRDYFYTRNIAQWPHRSGAIYLAVVGVNRKTWAWDGAIFKAPGDGTVSVHVEFVEGGLLQAHAANVAICEVLGGRLAGWLSVIFTRDNGGLYPPFGFVVEP